MSIFKIKIKNKYGVINKVFFRGFTTEILIGNQIKKFIMSKFLYLKQNYDTQNFEIILQEMKKFIFCTYKKKYSLNKILNILEKEQRINMIKAWKDENLFIVKEKENQLKLKINSFNLMYQKYINNAKKHTLLHFCENTFLIEKINVFNLEFNKQKSLVQKQIFLEQSLNKSDSTYFKNFMLGINKYFVNQEISWLLVKIIIKSLIEKKESWLKLYSYDFIGCIQILVKEPPKKVLKNMNKEDFIYNESQIYGCGLLINDFIRKLHLLFENHCQEEAFFKKKETNDIESEKSLSQLLIEKKCLIESRLKKGEKEDKEYLLWKENYTKSLKNLQKKIKNLKERIKTNSQGKKLRAFLTAVFFILEETTNIKICRRWVTRYDWTKSKKSEVFNSYYETWAVWQDVDYLNVDLMWNNVHYRPMVLKPLDWKIVNVENKIFFKFGGYLLNKKGIMDLIVIKQFQKLEVIKMDNNLIEKINQIQKQPLIISQDIIIKNFDCFLDFFNNLFTKIEEIEAMHSVLNDRPKKIDFIKFCNTYKKDQSNIDFLNKKITDIILFFKFIFEIWNNKEQYIKLYFPCFLDRSLRKHYFHILNTNQMPILRYVTVFPTVKKVDYFLRFKSCLRLLEKQPIFPLDSEKWLKEHYLDFLNKCDLKNKDLDLILQFNLLKDNFFKYDINTGVSFDASAQVLQICCLLFWDLRIINLCNIFGDDYNDIYLFLIKEIKIEENLILPNGETIALSKEFFSWFHQRKIIKRWIVRIFYGGVAIGILSEFQKELEVFFAHNHLIYIVGHIRKSILFYFNDVEVYIKNLTVIATIISKKKEYFNFKIDCLETRVAFFEKKKSRILLKNIEFFKSYKYKGRIEIWENGKFNNNKLKNSLLTWIFHSRDAILAREVTLRAKKELNLEIITVFDCFIAPCEYQDELRKIYFEEILKITKKLSWKEILCIEKNTDFEDCFKEWLCDETFNKKLSKKRNEKTKKDLLENREIILNAIKDLDLIEKKISVNKSLRDKTLSVNPFCLYEG